MLTCEFCNKEYTNKYTLKTHQTKNKKCLALRDKIIKESPKIKCADCDKYLSNIRYLKNHYIICAPRIVRELKEKHKEEINKLKEKHKSIIFDINMEINKKQLKIQDLNKNVTMLKNRLDEITNLMASNSPIQDTPFSIAEVSNTFCEYKIPSLTIGQGYHIEYRQQDGYINITDLCKAGEKEFKKWEKDPKTEAFLKVLSLKNIEAIKYDINSIWAHPLITINIAKWISPEFEVNISDWVYKEIHKENKNKNIRIKLLEKKCLKRHRRVIYDDKYVIYILTTKLMYKERRYIMGKATNLTNRLSTYNKSDEHRVVYYKGCGSEEIMSLVENMVFHHLEEYREQANRERFILPKNKEVKLFENIINKSIEYFKKE
jgi:gas vesicle protein